ncbi:Tetratricopeptide-like helical [Penicillium expansum]|nr:Tetratricopeptide-like helical [Penicillium expansum]
MTVETIFPVSTDGKRDDLCVDIVAVHGLDENGMTAWIHPSNGCFWLRDLLPNEGFKARIFTVNYKADATSFFSSSSADRISHHAQTLVEELNAEREHDDSIQRPIIFLCHGLGGLIVKKALIYASTCTSAKMTHLHSVFTSTFGLIFFGTPHEAISSHLWRRDRKLSRPSPSNSPLLKNFYVHNFWETLETSRSIGSGYIVSYSSAAPPWDDTGRSGLPATHSQMCKFGDREQPGYKLTCGILHRFIKLASPLIASRHRESHSFLAARRGHEATEILAFDIHHDNKPISFKLKPATDSQNQYFLVPLAVSDNYTGRERLARGLQEKLLAPNIRQKRFVLYDNRDNFWGVFWVDASSPKAAEQAFSGLARIGKVEEKLESGLYWLSTQDMPWLLVIDNADDADFDYAKYFPLGAKGHILVTSRNPDCKVHATIGFEEFANLEEEDSITLLLRSAIVSDLHDLNARATARPIVQALGCLPLALIQAGASIRQNICSLEDYLNVFNSYKRKLFLNGIQQGQGSYAHNVFTTFEVSYNKIRSLTTDEAREAIEILHVMAFLHFDQIPGTLFEKAWEGFFNHGKLDTLSRLADRITQIPGDLVTLSSGYGGWFTMFAEGRLPCIFSQTENSWDKLRFRKAIHLLWSYSLILQNVNLGSYSMHPMVQFWARERLQGKAQKIWGNIASRVLAESITTISEDSELSSTIQIMGQFERFATVYAEGGRWNDAAAIQERILNTKGDLLGKDSFEALDAMADASSYGQLESYTLVVRFYLESRQTGATIIRGIGANIGAGPSYTLSAMHSFGRTRLHLVDLKKAQELLLRAWEGRAKLFGATHLDTLETMQDLGMTCLALKEIEEAEKLVSFVLDCRKRLLGNEHAHTLWSINDLAKVYCAQGYPEDAIVLLIPTREIATRTLGSKALGPKHPDVFSAKMELAEVLMKMGKVHKSEEQSQEAIEGISILFGPESPRTIHAKARQAAICKLGDKPHPAMISSFKTTEV